MSTQTIIKAHDVRKSFGSTHALRGANLAVNSGEVLAIMGLSGSGKSTLQRTPVRESGGNLIDGTTGQIIDRNDSDLHR